MSNDLIRDSAGVPSDTGRIKHHGAVVAFGLGGLYRAGRSGGGYYRWLAGFDVAPGTVPPPVGTGGAVSCSICFRAASGFTSRLGIVPGNPNVGAMAETAITGCQIVIAFCISKGILLPRQERKPGANGVHEKSEVWRRGK